MDDWESEGEAQNRDLKREKYVGDDDAEAVFEECEDCDGSV